ncbi:hypothetical protein AB1Y20_009722 [Prymnesium parvum]|uniref:Uncharacterized protein n=1 Tax=Prymnesium parvum TaxID=97485 RepID=A0AB34K6P9_PRYPA
MSEGKSHRGVSLSNADGKRLSIMQIVERRRQTLEYIKRVCAGERHWLSVVLLPSADDAKSQQDKQAREAETAQALRWFYLGVSIAPINSVLDGAAFVKALLQLFEEYQYHFASAARLKNTKRHSRPSSRLPSYSTSDDDFSVTLSRVNGEVVYDYLFTPCVAHVLSAAHVLTAFCEQLQKTYKNIADLAPVASTFLTDAVVKIDGLIEEHFLTSVAKHINLAASGAIKQSVSSCDPIFKRMLFPSSGNSRNTSDDGAEFGGRIPAPGPVMSHVI